MQLNWEEQGNIADIVLPARQMRRAMKLTVIILIVSFLQASANGYGQGVITLSMKDAPLLKVLKAIARQTNFVFAYEESVIQKAKKVNIDVTNTPINEVLEICFRDQPLIYEIEDRMIMIREKKISTSLNNLISSGISPNIDIKGRITNEKSEPINGANVTEKGTKNVTATNDRGEFILTNVAENATLIITSVGYESREVRLNGSTEINLQLNVQAVDLETVTVLSNGYQTVAPNQATGSYASVGKELLNRRVSTGILDRIENLTTGLSFNTPNEPTGNNPSGILIRGRNSIFSNVAPLIVVDNFPYDGSINNINPNDVESITILKDAAAAAVWGARAGNGVIVITTKRGKTTKPQINFNSNLTTQGKPDLDKLPRISSNDYIELEKWLFGKGYYNGDINNSVVRPPLSPVVEILLKKRNGLISEAEANSQIDILGSSNANDDLEKYFYRPSQAQQHSINVSGSTQHVNYYMSAGFDRTIPNVTGRSHLDRISLRSLNTFKVSQDIEIDAGIAYTQQNGIVGNNLGVNTNSGFGKKLYPYADLVDDNGNALAIVKDQRKIYRDTLGGGKLLDWAYKPYDEIGRAESTNKNRDFLINVGVKYKFSNSLRAEVRYQFENGVTSSNFVQHDNSYGARDIINRFYQPNATRKYPVPLGGILDINNSEFVSHQGRFQLSYIKLWNDKHELSAIGGWEIKDLRTTGNSSRSYGYSREGSRVNAGIDFVTRYPQFQYGIFAQNFATEIPNSQTVSETLDRFISYYANGVYTFDKRYTISASAREDAANLFGVRTNQKGVPLWSIGIGWQLSNEKFYKISWLENLRIRGSFGYNGNFSREVSAQSTISYYPTPNIVGLTYANILNPPNENLRWERNRILNIGADFSTKNNRISGSVDYYVKRNIDLMAQAAIDPTAGQTPVNGGISYLYRNVASMKGHGLEIMLNSININKKFKWMSSFLYTSAFTEVYEYFIPAATQSRAYVGINNTPLVGKPLSKIYSYSWAGLNHNTGNPQGYLGKDISEDYGAIINNTAVDSLNYHGSIQPTHFGALRNEFTWKNISFSVNVSYKTGYYFVRNTIAYSDLFRNWNGHSDYEKRWQNPGDETFTNVPSRIYVDQPQFIDREFFYLRSSALVEKADHIKIEDINFTYSIYKTNSRKLPFREIRFYTYLNNLNIFLWRENNHKVDPAIIDGNIYPIRLAVGMRIGI